MTDDLNQATSNETNDNSPKQGNVLNLYGIDVSKLTKVYTSAWKATWEQVLLICIYARQRYLIANFDLSNFREEISRLEEIVNQCIKCLESKEKLEDSDKTFIKTHFSEVQQMLLPEKTIFKFAIADTFKDHFDADVKRRDHVIKSMQAAIDVMDGKKKTKNIVGDTKESVGLALQAIRTDVIGASNLVVANIEQQKTVSTNVLKRMQLVKILNDEKKRYLAEIDSVQQQITKREPGQSWQEELEINKNNLKLLESIVYHVLVLLEDGVGSSEIIVYLQNENNDVSKDLLRIIEEKMIGFRPLLDVDFIGGFSSLSRIHYSYYSLAQVYDPINALKIFDQLLTIPDPTEEWIAQRACAFINNVLQNKFHGYSFEKFAVSPYRIKNRFIENSPIEESNISKYLDNKDYYSLAEYVNKSGQFTYDQISQQDLEEHLAKYLGDATSKVFGFVINPFYKTQKSILMNNKNLFNSSFTKSQDNDLTTITIENQLLKNVGEMGIIEEFAKRIARVLVDRNAAYQTTDNNGALVEVNAWFDKRKTDLIKKSDQIPKLIASVLEFDQRFVIKDGKARYKTVTDVISKDLYGKRSSSRIVFTKYAHSFHSTDEYSHLMFTWTWANNTVVINKPANEVKVLNQGELEDMAVSRFKKMPEYLKNDGNFDKFSYFDYMITQQKKPDPKAPPFPVSSSFSMPLWVKRDLKKLYLESED